MSLKRVADSAWLSSLSTLDANTIEKTLLQRDYKLIKFISIDSMQCYIAQHNKDQVVVFRESEPIFKNGKLSKEGIRDWIRNISFVPKNTPYGIMHTGFFKVLIKARREIMKYVTDKNFICIGMSQGGSLARMFAHIITKREVLSGYKPFFISFEPAMESKTNDYNTYGIWVMKGNDIITMLPLHLTGWDQSGNCIYITGKSEKLFINPKKLKKAIMVASDTVMDFDDGLSFDDIMRDHNIIEVKKVWEIPKYENKILAFAKERFNFK